MNHTHGSNPARVEVVKKITDMKMRAESAMETPGQIINAVTTTASTACLGQLQTNPFGGF